MEPNNKLPGLTFHLLHSTLSGHHGTVSLGATINDPDVWHAVIAKFDNFRVYTVANLSTAFIDVLEQDNKELQASYTIELAALRSELEQARQRLSILEQRDRAYQRFELELTLLGNKLKAQ